MHERFTEGWRAAAYISSGVLTDFPNSTFDVTLTLRGQRFRKVCKAADLGGVLVEMCKNFPKASAYYYPDEEYGYIAEIHCHCGHEKSQACCKSEGFHRGKVRILFKEIEYRGGKEVAHAVHETGVTAGSYR